MQKIKCLSLTLRTFSLYQPWARKLPPSKSWTYKHPTDLETPIWLTFLHTQLIGISDSSGNTRPNAVYPAWKYSSQLIIADHGSWCWIMYRQELITYNRHTKVYGVYDSHMKQRRKLHFQRLFVGIVFAFCFIFLTHFCKPIPTSWQPSPTNQVKDTYIANRRSQFLCSYINPPVRHSFSRNEYLVS